MGKIKDVLINHEDIFGFISEDLSEMVSNVEDYNKIKNDERLLLGNTKVNLDLLHLYVLWAKEEVKFVLYITADNLSTVSSSEAQARTRFVVQKYGDKNIGFNVKKHAHEFVIIKKLPTFIKV